VAISNARNGYINGSTSGWVARSLFVAPTGERFALVASTSSNVLEMYEHNYDGTFTLLDGSNSPAHSNSAHSYDGNVPYTWNGYIYAARRSATNTVRVTRFDTSTKTWESTDIGAANASTTVHADFGIGVAIRSDGDVILGYRDTASNDIYYTRYEGSTWSSETNVHSSNTSILLSLTMTGNSDLAHFWFYEQTATDVTCRSIDSSNTLGTTQDADLSVSAMFSQFMGYVNDGGTHRIASLQRDSGGEADLIFSTSSATPAFSVTNAVSPSSTTDPGLLGGTVVPFQNRYQAIWSGDGRGAIHADRSDDYASPAFGTDRDVITGLANDPACYAVAAPTGIPVLYTDHTGPSVDLVWALGSPPAPGIVLSDGVASANTSSATTLAVAKPSGLADDDVAYITVHLSSGTISATPSGFSLLQSDLTQTGCRLYLYRKVITNAAGEPSTWDFTTSSTTSSGISWWARGADLTTPEDTAVSVATDAADSGGTTITGVTTTMDDTVLITITCFNQTGTSIYGPTQSADVLRQTAASYRRQVVAYESRPSAGATGNRSAMSSTAGGPSANFAFAIRPASAPTGGSIAGSSSGTSAASLAASHPAAIAGVSSGSSAASFVVQRPVIAGTSAGVSAASAHITNDPAVSGTSSGQSTASLAADITRPIAGESTGTSAAALTISGHRIAGSSIGTSAASADVTCGHGISGSSAGTSDGSLSLDAVRTIAGTSIGLSDAAAQIDIARPITGSSSSTSDASANIVAPGADPEVAGTSVGTSQASADIGVANAISGTSTGSSASSLDAHATGAVSGTSAGTSLSSLVIAAINAIGGTSTGVSDGTLDADSERQIVGLSSGVSLSSTVIAAINAIAGESIGVSDATADILATPRPIGPATATTDVVPALSATTDMLAALTASTDVLVALSATTDVLPALTASTDLIAALYATAEMISQETP